MPPRDTTSVMTLVMPGMPGMPGIRVSGAQQYDPWQAGTWRGNVSVNVASIDDLIRMKTAAGRPKDRIEVEILSALREELGD